MLRLGFAFGESPKPACDAGQQGEGQRISSRAAQSDETKRIVARFSRYRRVVRLPFDGGHARQFAD
jgi:hypothetical protein